MMFKETVRRPVCLDCEFYKWYEDFIPRQYRNIRVSLGDRYCDHPRKARKFKKGEMRYTPDWCPKRKKQPTLKVYKLTEQGKFLAAMWPMDEPLISLHDYEVRYSGKSERSAWDIVQRLDEKLSPSEAFGVPVEATELVEIDDGIYPYFFYISFTSATPVFVPPQIKQGGSDHEKRKS